MCYEVDTGETGILRELIRLDKSNKCATLLVAAQIRRPG
jgi:hypothetical protein